MRFRTLALVLALGFGLTMGAEAKKKTSTVYHPKSHVVKAKNSKGKNYKARKYKAQKIKRNKNLHR